MAQESVWDYPRPPRVEDSAKHIQVVFNGEVIADTRRARRVLETSHPPSLGHLRGAQAPRAGKGAGVQPGVHDPQQ